MTRPQVAFLGNMNNNHFALARFLRDRGVDAHVLMFDDDPSHFHPACDSYDLAYRGFTRQLSWGGLRSFHLTPAAAIRRDLEPFDVLIGCGAAPAYLRKAGLDLDVFVPYGGDIWALAGRSSGNALDWLKNATIAGAQRRGIKRSKVFHMTPTNALYEGQWERLRGGSTRWVEGIPMVYTGCHGPDHAAKMASRTHWAHEFERIRGSCDLMLFSAVRHFWKCAPQHPAAKGTKQLFEGIARLRARHPELRVKLATLEYGRDVQASKALARELGIEDAIEWLPAMFRKDLMIGLALADVALGEFENSWISSGVIYEALAMGKPLLAHREDALYEKSQLYEILHAKTSEEIADALETYLKDPDLARSMGERGRAWYEREVVERTCAKYVDHITRTSDG